MISLVVRASVPYAAIAAQALAVVERHPYSIDSRLVRGRVHVGDVVVRPSGAQLTVAVTFRAEMAWPLPKVRGTVNVAATPVYDAERQRLRLSGVSIVGDVDHVLARAALAFGRRRLVEALEGFSMDFGPLLRDLRDRLNAGLAGHAVAPNAALAGRVETLRVDDIVLSDELIVVASASGRLDVVFEPPTGQATPPRLEDTR